VHFRRANITNFGVHLEYPGPGDISIEEHAEKPAGAAPKNRSFVKRRTTGGTATSTRGTQSGDGASTDAGDDDQPDDLGAMPDKILLARLKAWRLDISRNHGIPAFRVLTDKSIRQIAIDKPATVEDLGRISGIGRHFLDEYADEVLKLVARD